MYRTLIVRGISEMKDIVELTAKYLSHHAETFVDSGNGWVSVSWILHKHVILTV